MISLVRFLERGRFMEGQKRPREIAINFVGEEERRDAASALGIRSEILKDGAPDEYGYAAEVPDVDALRHGQEESCDDGKGFKDYQDGEGDTAAIAGYGHMIGQLSNMGGDFRRVNQWNSESLSDYSEKYKRIVAPDAGLEERRVRSRPEASVLTNLLGRRDETDLNMNISARTLRPSGGKDRHSKVFTAKGPRDRRVRLSVSTAIQFYDVQDRLGYDQPSKAVEWLMKKAKNAIDELSQIPLPGIDRMVPSSSSSVYHPYGYSSSAALSAHESPDFAHPTSFTSTSEVQQLKGLQQQQQSNHLSENPSSELKSSSREQLVDESDTFPRPRRELGTDITMSVGEAGSSRRNQVHAHHHHPSLTTFTPQNNLSAAASEHSLQHPRDWKSLTSSSSYNMYEDPCAALPPDQHQQGQQQQQGRFSGLFQTPLQYHHHQQTSLITVQQTYLQQQDFLAGTGTLHNPGVLPFAMPAAAATSQTGAKPYLEQFHSLKLAAAGGTTTTADKPPTGTTSSSISSTSCRFPTGFLGSGLSSSSSAPNVYSPKQHQQQQQQQQQQIQIGGGAVSGRTMSSSGIQFGVDASRVQDMEEQLRRGGGKRN